MLERLKKLVNPVKAPQQTEEAEEEYSVPELRPVKMDLTVELMCRRREEALIKKYGAEKPKDGGFL